MMAMNPMAHEASVHDHMSGSHSRKRQKYNDDDHKLEKMTVVCAATP